MGSHPEATVLVLLAALLGVSRSATQYYGSKIGPFRTYVHGVVGDLFAVDHKTIFIKGFSYDGEGPDAFFWAGSTRKPDATGFIIPDEKGTKKPLKAYRNQDILIRLPPGKTLKDIKWLSVWCRKFSANFAEIFIPADLQIPRPVEIGSIPTLEHGVSSKSVMVIDAQTLLVPDFKYDGKGPAAYWWASRGARQHPRGLRLADENGSFAPLPRYTGKTVVITFPDGKTIYDYDWFGVWCEEAQVNFGSVRLPQHILVPPSPRMLGIELEYKLNCEILYDDLGFEVRWIMDGEDVVIQLVAKLEPNEYMSFGLSQNDTKSEMINADVAVAWLDKNGKGHAVDYFLGSKEQCVGRRGSCPDTKHPDGQNSVTLLNTAIVNAYTMITFKRPQVGGDKYDQHVYSDGPQAIVWAIGPLNDRDEVSYHSLRTEGDFFIDFARPPQWNCPQPADATSTASPPTTTAKPPSRKPVPTVSGRKPKPNTSASDNRKKIVSSRSRTSISGRESDSRTSASTLESVWHIPSITCPSDRTFRAQIGPAGGKKGYQAKTGHVGWGIAWYINGLLIPEITVQRGKTYTFIVEGGNNPENPARYHPFYISDDPEGGFDHKTLAEKRRTRIFAGVSRDRTGIYAPTAAGRMCEWKLPKDDDVTPDDFNSYEEFQQRLELRCESGKEGKVRWRPDKNTPDLVYYQCYNHRHLGWKIHVVDSCEESLDSEAEASVRQEKNVTYNTLSPNMPVSDLRRGSTKQKIQNLEDGRRAFPPEFRGNDGIPLILTEPDIQRGSGTDESKDISKKVPTPSQFKTTTTLSQEPWNRYSTEASFPFVKDIAQNAKEHSTQKNFQQQGTRAANPRPFKSNQDSWTGLTLNKTYVTRHPVSVRKTVSREKTPWWKPIAHHPPAPASVNRHKAIQTLKTQLAVIRNTKQDPSDLPLHSASTSNVRQSPGHQEKSFIPVVIKESSSIKTGKRIPVVIRKVVKNMPNDGNKNSHLFNSYREPSSNGANRGWQQPTAPVPVHSKVTPNFPPIRRNTGHSTKNFVNIALSNVPISQTSVRRKTTSTYGGDSGSLYLPVVITSTPKINRTLNTNGRSSGHRGSSTSPLIPVMIPEGTEDDAYFLYHIMPLIKQQLEKHGVK